jgi:hypothetical protein
MKAWLKTNAVGMVGLLCSFLAPTYVYCNLDMKLQELKHHARLTYDESESVKIQEREYHMSVKNVGDFPASGIAVVFEFAGGVEIPDPKRIEISPPSPVETSVDGRHITCRLHHALGKDQFLFFRIDGIKVEDDGKVKPLKHSHGVDFENMLAGPDPYQKSVVAWVFSDQGNAKHGGSKIISLLPPKVDGFQRAFPF